MIHPPASRIEQLHTPSEPQWFPRPITDTIESTLSHLERLEENRRRRLRAIANVAARVPIGLGGVEDRGGSSGGGVATANVSPKPNHRPGNYGRYRYYPPTEETPVDESISLHTSYRNDANYNNSTAASSSSFSPLVTGRSPERRRNHNHHRQRAAATAVNNRSRNGSSSRSTSHSPRRDLHTPTDGIEIGMPTNNHMEDDNSGDSGSSSIEGGRFIDSFNVSTSAVLFLSPPFDPRSGGGGRRGSIASSSQNSSMMRSPWHLHQQQSSTSVDWSMSTPHNNAIQLDASTVAASSQQHQRQLRVETSAPAADAAAIMDDADLITPPAIQPPSSNEYGSAQHGHGEDVYSQRRGATSVRRSQRQRRRRRDWE